MFDVTGDLVLEAGEALGVVDEGLGAFRVELVDVDVQADRGVVAVEGQGAERETLIFVPPVRDGRRVMVVFIGPTWARTLPTISSPSQAPMTTTMTRPRARGQGWGCGTSSTVGRGRRARYWRIRACWARRRRFRAATGTLAIGPVCPGVGAGMRGGSRE